MWAAAEEPPGTMEGGPPEQPDAEACDQQKTQLESFQQIITRNKQSLKEKEQEAQAYAKQLSKFKARAKYARKNKDGAASSAEAGAKPSGEDSIDDVSQATTPKAKSSLLQKKLAEDREMFERRSKEMTENKRAVEEKVEAIKQQLDENTVAMLDPSVYQTLNQTSSSTLGNFQDDKTIELSSRVKELEAMVLDLQENLKEKDSVIESKMQAVTLMSADLSKKGKITLDTLEDTKGEMRSMQENFSLMESSLKNKNEYLLEQLKEREDTIAGLEDNIRKYEERLEAQKLAESASADFSRSTMDNLLETKDAMKSMQENFVLVETSLKSKNDHLLQQLEERELKLAEAQARIFHLESGAGIDRPPQLEDLEYKILQLEQTNRELQNEKYELQKSIADLQNKLLTSEPVFVEGIVVEKNSRIAELENLVEQLRRSNQLLEEESKDELQNQVVELTTKNEELVETVADLEQKLNELETQRSANSGESTSPKSDDVAKLTKELDELNKSMIKLKAQHKTQMKNLRKQLENFKKISDTNAELVRLGNQVTLLEEEKASMGDLNNKIAELENKVTSQANEIESHLEAVVQLENQKLDLTQELIAAKQEISNLEAENAESENLRVTAEMKIVELEEQLETLNKFQPDNKQSENSEEIESLKRQVDVLSQENADLVQKLMKHEEKGSSDAGSTESFETIHEADKLIKKIDSLTQKNSDLERKLCKLEEKSSNVDSTDSFENISEIDKSELVKRVDLLTRENTDLVMKLSRFEEKGSSDTGSTESFEKIPEHVETVSKVELLTRENNELVIKVTKLEEKLHELNIQFTEMDKKNLELVAENSGLKEQQSLVKILENQIEDYKSSIAEQKDAFEDLKRKLAEKDEELRMSSNAPRESSEDILALQQEIRDCYSSIEEWKYKYASMEEAMEKLESEKASIQQTLTSLKAENNELQAQLEENHGSLSSERLNVQKLNDELESQQQEISALNSAMNLKEKEILDLQQLISEKQIQLEEISQKLLLQGEMIKSLQTELNDQRSEGDNSKDIISSLKEELAKLSSKSEDRESFLKKATEEYDNLLQDLANKNAAYNLLQMQMDQYKDEIENYKTQLAGLSERNDEQQATIEELENRLYESQGMLDNNKMYVEELKRELSKTQELGEKLNAKYIEDTENYSKKLDEVMLQLQEKVAENETLTERLEAKDSQVTEEVKANLESKINELEDDIKAKIEKMKKFAVKLKRKTAQCEELEHKIVNIEEQLSTEKEQKEALNLEIQKSTASLQEKDEKISELKNSLTLSSETMSSLTQQLTETRQRLEEILQAVQSVGEETIEGLIERMNRQQIEIEESKEKARELGVRMQVMEAKYVDQLFDIQNLQANNGLLLSKQEQITERLENSEKISEERRSQLEQIESERGTEVVASKEETETQTSTDESRSHCEHCENCHTLVREMEAKLQERDAEIENLDNELATSIGNFVQMQEDLRNNQAEQGVNIRDAYNELSVQYNTLRTMNENLKTQLDSTLQENKELMEKISSLQQLSETLQDTLDRPDPTLVGELEILRANLAEKERLKEQYEEEIRSLREEIEQLKKKDEKVEPEETPIFDAFKAFDMTPDQELINKLQKDVQERDSECIKVQEQLIKLNYEISQERELAQQTQNKLSEEIARLQSRLESELERHLNPLCASDREEIEMLKKIINEREQQLEQLSMELESLRDERQRVVEEKNSLSVTLHNSRLSFESQLREVLDEKEEMEAKLRSFSAQHVEFSQEIEALQITISNMEQKEEEDNKLLNFNEAEMNNLKEEVVRYQDENNKLRIKIHEIDEELNTALSEKQNLMEQVEALKKKEQQKEELSVKVERPVVESQPPQETTVEEDVEQLVLDEGWGLDGGWNPDQTQEMIPTVTSNLEADLMAKITNLECEITKLEREKGILSESNKALQVRCDKAVKKLMQKIKQEKLMQMHQQKSTSSLCDLDQAIVDELKDQIKSLEKSQSETEEKLKETLAEKENLVKRIDILVAANERYLEMKERQDMSVEVYEIRNKELSAKVEALESLLQSASQPLPAQVPAQVATVVEQVFQTASAEQVSEPGPSICELERHQEQITELKESLEALASENEQLQHLLDEQRNSRLELESKLASEYSLKLEESDSKLSQVSTDHIKLKEEYDFLRKQYEQTLMDANDQVQAIRRNNEILQEELNERIMRHEADLSAMEGTRSQEIAAITEELQKALQAKESVEHQLGSLSTAEEKFSTASSSLMDVSELLNLRVQEVAALKEELKHQCDDRIFMEKSLHESNEKLLMGLNEKQSKLDEYMALVTEQECKLGIQTEEIKQLKESLREFEQSRQEYVEELNAKNAEIEKHLQELKRLQEIVNEKESIFSACQSDTDLKDREISDQVALVTQCELELKKYVEEVEKYSAEVHRLKDLLYEEANRRTALLEERLGLKLDLTEKTLNLERCEVDIQKCIEDVEKGSKETDRLNNIIQRDQVEIERLSSVMQSESVNFNALISHLTMKDQQIGELKQALDARDETINNLNSVLAEKDAQLNKLVEEKEKDPIDNIPIFTMSEDDDVGRLRAELVAKQVEIDNLTYALNKNTYPKILQDLQDTINKLYNEKAQLEMALAVCEEENQKLKEQLNVQSHEYQTKEDVRREALEDRLGSNQEEIARLQNELHLKEQEINELKYVISEKDAKMLASSESSSDDLELRQTIEMLNSQLYSKHQEIEYLTATINQLSSELENAKRYEAFSEEYKAAFEVLQTEKEQSAREFEVKLHKVLEEKNLELADLLNKKEAEKMETLENLRMKQGEIDSLQRQLDECHEQLHEQDRDFAYARNDLAEKERRLAELSITKDTEIYNLKVLLHERDVRIEELHALSDEENKQLIELKAMLTKKDEEIEELKSHLTEKVQEFELVQSALQRHVPQNLELSASRGEASGLQETDAASSELDLALYMLHQRDVRCEELTQELMQLLEERDTLQLRLSNAIRVNEELRKFADAKDHESKSLPQVEKPSPEKSEGPVEIAREAINTPINLNEDHNALVEKLSQLHNVGHAKDVRLKDDRELRHNQQRTLLAHKEALSSLPPEAAARLVNANYTLSRDTQSQSSVLLNWLWGKSTPKVVNM